MGSECSKLANKGKVVFRWGGEICEGADGSWDVEGDGRDVSADETHGDKGEGMEVSDNVG